MIEPRREIPPGLRIEMSYPDREATQPLWLPPRLKRRVVVPEFFHTQKTIYFKGRLYGSRFRDHRWYGGIRECHYNVDLDEAGDDGLTARDQIHIYLTGILERVAIADIGRFVPPTRSDGVNNFWVYQDSDERWSTTVIEEWPKFQHSNERWARFWRREI